MAELRASLASAEDPSSVPTTHIRCLTTACYSSARGLLLLVTMGTCTYVRTPLLHSYMPTHTRFFFNVGRRGNPRVNKIRSEPGLLIRAKTLMPGGLARQYTETSNCSPLLPTVYSLRPLAYRSLLQRPMTPASVLILIDIRRFWGSGGGAPEEFTQHTCPQLLCAWSGRLSFIFSLPLVRVPRWSHMGYGKKRKGH